jgi:hypothetical protein
VEQDSFHLSLAIVVAVFGLVRCSAAKANSRLVILAELTELGDLYFCPATRSQLEMVTFEICVEELRTLFTVGLSPPLHYESCLLTS